MIIRHATKADISQLVKLAEDFYTVSPYSQLVEFDEASLESVLLSVIDSKDATCIIAIVDSNIVALLPTIIIPLFINPKFTMAQEIFWWVDKSYRNIGIGKAMIAELEYWSKSKNCNAVLMASLADSPEVDLLYESLSYRSAESFWIKRI